MILVLTEDFYLNLNLVHDIFINCRISVKNEIPHIMINLSAAIIVH